MPDAPTSMGENARVLPKPFARVPEEQIRDTSKRRRSLFADESTDRVLEDFGRRILDAGLADLDHTLELRELGMALFLDRPLGALKEAGEVDRTPLLSYEAFSRAIARRRIAAFKAAGWIDQHRHDALLRALGELAVAGVAIDQVSIVERAGVVSVADARKASADFLLLRTTRSSLDALFAHYDLRPLAAVSPRVCRWLLESNDVLLVPHHAADEPTRPLLRLYSGGELQLKLGFARDRSTMGIYRQRAGVELVERLLVLTIADATGGRRGESLWIGMRTRI